MLSPTVICIMVKTKVVCQDEFLAREPTPEEVRIEESWYPIEDGEITERVQGFSLVPPYSSRQLREIQRRHIKKCKLDRRYQAGVGVEVKMH
jgi:hypothetical protein